MPMRNDVVWYHVYVRSLCVFLSYAYLVYMREKLLLAYFKEKGFSSLSLSLLKTRLNISNKKIHKNI